MRYREINREQLQVLLDKVGTEVNIELYQRRITNRLEAVDLAGLDDKDIAGVATAPNRAYHGIGTPKR